MARPVHGFLLVLTGAAMTACVVPPPLEVEELADASVNSPPLIVEARDTTADPLRPPATLILNMATPAVPIEVVVFDLDVQDEITVRLFVDYQTDPQPQVTCLAPTPSATPTRTLSCSTSGLCDAVGDYVLEIEAYDRPPLLEPPYRNASNEFFSTWTLDLSCINEL